MNQLKQDILNTTGVRPILRKSTQEIERLESLDSLRDLRLTSLSTDSFIGLSYEATATSAMYPHVRAKLIEAGVIKRHNVVGTRVGNQGQSDEYESLHLAFHGSSVQAFLKVYNPNYQSQ